MEDQFCLPERKFSQGKRISWKVAQNSQTEFPNRKCASHLLVFASSKLALYIIPYLPEKSRGNGTSASPYVETSIRDLTRPIYDNLSTNRFFRVNLGKQPVTLSKHLTTAPGNECMIQAVWRNAATVVKRGFSLWQSGQVSRNWLVHESEDLVQYLSNIRCILLKRSFALEKSAESNEKLIMLKLS